ncbi:hypothetical protein QWY79_12220 [Halomonas sabkhae]|uniref:hypothetical protein n=1 Tax=Halomonas sabkhae TaxID=626223 RepID=UPI0025B46F54|nr:hypothetical protein [Halomonas sabkhae]MDN3526030.1 hypothetical protein [Halomonas sabkhae]
MKVSCTVYDIARLGYYNRGEEVAGFPSMEKCLDSFVDWGKSVTQIDNTKTYAPSGSTTRHATFFADGHHDRASGETVVVLWKEVNSNKGDVYGLSRSNRPGHGQVTTRSFDYKKYIPGFPVYFWFFPREKKMLALEFEHSDKGKMNLVHYLYGFLGWRATPWCVSSSKVKVTEHNYDKTLLGYSPDGSSSNIHGHVKPRVDIDICKSGDVLKQLLAVRPKITRLQRTEAIEFSSDANESRTVAERVYEDGVFKGLVYKPRRLAKVRYKSEITWKPTYEEVVELFDEVSGVGPSDGLENLVALTSDQKRVSFFGNAIKDDIDISVAGKIDGFVPAGKLYSALDGARKLFP